MKVRKRKIRSGPAWLVRGSRLAAGLALVFCLSGCEPPYDKALDYPSFGGEVELSISGYGQDAMEPFVSADGSLLFFNSLNDGTTTSLHWAERSAEGVYDYKGEIGGVNGSGEHLDAVASMDDAGAFFWVSTRDWPAVLENLRWGSFHGGQVSDGAAVQGNFYLAEPGWLVMDAEISRDGGSLFYVNSRFDSGGLKEAKLGLALKTAAGNFAVHGQAQSILSNLRYPEHLAYAPATSADGLELYFTRVRKGSLDTKICLALRGSADEAFSLAKVIEIPGKLVEAPCISPDGSVLYYHKKAADGRYHIYSMRRLP